jgi:hypothetical protein
LAQAKASYKEAYELGDTEKMIEAQENLTSLNNDMYRVNNYKPRPAQQPAPQAVQQPQRPQAPKLDERQERWLSDNDWYGKDRQMTAFALGVHEELVYNGVDPNSDKYYTEINSAVRNGSRINSRTISKRSKSHPRRRPMWWPQLLVARKIHRRSSLRRLK